MKHKNFLIVSVLSLLIALSESSPINATLHMLSHYPLAKCMDGSPAGYYLLPNTTIQGGNKFVIHLQGGGECDTKEACLSAMNSSLGSSTSWPQEKEIGSFFLWSTESYNPDFYDAVRILIGYCSQDLWSGTRQSPSQETWGVLFSGHLIVESVLKDVSLKYGLGKRVGQTLLLSGDSAGGIGTWMNVDFIAKKFANLRVIATPFAGFYFTASVTYSGPNHTRSYLANFSSSGLQIAYHLWQSFVDVDCAVALATTPWMCILANNSLPFITAEAFVFEAQTDEVVLEAHAWVPPPPLLCNPPESTYVTEWRDMMRSALTPFLNVSDTRRGVFNPACFIHTDFFPWSPVVDGLTYQTAFGNWYNKGPKTNPNTYKVSDKCETLYCNPTCKTPCPLL